MAAHKLHRERACGNSGHPGGNENALSFASSSARDQGSVALNLVYQAAEVFSDIEDQARETEARAKSMCESAADKLKFAERRVEAAERDRRETINQADRKLQDAWRALKHIKPPITIAATYRTTRTFPAPAT